jgi:hypothetical protein
VDGTAEEYTCSSGLWFDEYSGVCNWPEVTDRTECKADAYGENGLAFTFAFTYGFSLVTANGFICPEKPPTDELGQFDPHPKYAS